MPLVNALQIPFVTETVTYGRNNMPPFGTQLSEAQISALAGYVVNDLNKQAGQ